MSAEWYEVIEYFDGEPKPIKPGTEYKIRGSIGDVVIVQIDVAGLGEHLANALIRTAQKTLREAGIKEAIFVPKEVQFLRLRRVDDATVGSPGRGSN